MRTFLNELVGRTVVSPLDLDRDHADVDALLAAEEWPFLRTDLEVSHAQPRAAGFVARRDEQFAGFFTAHAFGHVGYLDMMIIAPPWRRRGVARPLYLQTIGTLQRYGVTGFVVHTTNDSAPLIERLGFSAGTAFSLLRRGPAEADARSGTDVPLVWLTAADRESILAQDAATFGIRRGPWVSALLRQPRVRFVGLRREGELAAVMSLRPRRHGAYCLDMVSAQDDAALDALIDGVVGQLDANRLECFARGGSRLESLLLARGFAVPEFFEAIGPLVEWRKGRTQGVGDSPRVHCLSWF